MNKNVLITEGVVGDIKVILEKINAKLRAAEPSGMDEEDYGVTKKNIH